MKIFFTLLGLSLPMVQGESWAEEKQASESPLPILLGGVSVSRPPDISFKNNEIPSRRCPAGTIPAIVGTVTGGKKWDFKEQHDLDMARVRAVMPQNGNGYYRVVTTSLSSRGGAWCLKRDELLLSFPLRGEKGAPGEKGARGPQGNPGDPGFHSLFGGPVLTVSNLGRDAGEPILTPSYGGTVGVRFRARQTLLLEGFSEVDYVGYMPRGRHFGIGLGGGPTLIVRERFLINASFVWRGFGLTPQTGLIRAEAQSFSGRVGVTLPKLMGRVRLSLFGELGGYEELSWLLGTGLTWELGDP